MGDRVITVDEIIRSQRDSILRGRRGTVLTGSAAQRFYEGLARVYGVGRSAIPVGTPISLADVEQPQVAGVSQVVSGSTGISTGSVYGLPGTSRRVTTTPNQAVLSTKQTTQEEAMDLGTIVTTLGSQYIQARFGQPASTPPGMPRPVMGITRVASDDTFGVVPSVGMSRVGLPALIAPGLGSSAMKIAAAMAAAVGATEITEDLILAATAASKVKCRRKRRRLATHSDIKDLAALKAVLGSGKAFDTWIATRKM